MKTYIIDGNNLIGNIRSLYKIQGKDRNSSREKLTLIIERYFKNKKVKVYLHFDGFENVKLSLSKGKIIYSDNVKADDKIRNQIEKIINRKNLILVSSDNELKNFAKVCRCQLINSGDFEKIINEKKVENEEKSKIDSISNDEIKKMFGL
jgi:predicted RNA-binding protein with PIN domain